MFNTLVTMKKQTIPPYPHMDPKLQEQVSRLARYALWHNGSMDVPGISNYLLIEVKACSTRQDLWMWVWKNQNYQSSQLYNLTNRYQVLQGNTPRKYLHIRIYCYLFHDIQGIETSLDIHQQMSGLNTLNRYRKMEL